MIRSKIFFQENVYITFKVFRMIAEVMEMREEEKKRPSQKFFSKRWAYPAMYLASAAIIITAILWYQAAGNDVAEDQELGYEEDVQTGNEFDRPAVEVNRTMENFVMPVADENEVVIEKGFYDANASEQEQEAALIVYDNQYHPNQGIDISLGGKDFDVLAAMSGTVTKVQEDSLLGNMIEVEHDKGIVTRYQSVKDFAVEVGDTVEQGQKLAAASQSLFNEKAGVHVHFEIRKDEVAVNPQEYVNKSLATLQEVSFDKKQSDVDAQADDQAETDVPDAADSQSDEGAEEEGSESTQSEEGSDSAEEENGTEDTDTEENADQGTDEGTEDSGSEEE
ncbi:peptidoglycan DD-metalloendopeptidase family protein [Rossellomorea aquimaris]|uniref:Peptidoglycan DD-metalloendopeptidase family protein n=2 Tax=Bacillaceae TaxID=186817 RepID=A0A5D4TW58_9BACI|nr:peptidoglycan DD-metalloendopeptidase family protein [Rossellomorea aquimaris]